MTIKQRSIAGQALRFVLMAFLMSFITFPFLVCVSNTLKTEGEINSITPSLIPKNITFSNIKELFADPQFLLGMRNSAFIAIVTMLLVLLVSLPAAYVIARGSGKLAPLAQGWIVISQMIPIITLTVPIYMILKQIRLTDSIPGIILVYLIWNIPTTLWLLKGFITGFPRGWKKQPLSTAAVCLVYSPAFCCPISCRAL